MRQSSHAPAAIFSNRSLILIIPVDIRSL